MFDNKINSNRPAAFAPGKLHDLQACFHAAGLPHTVTVSPTLAERYGWLEPATPSIDRYEVAWLVRLALTGHWPHRQRKTKDGVILLLEFPVLNGAHKAADLQLGAVLGEGQKIHLVAPEELDQAAPKQACVLAADDDPDVASVICAVLERSGFTVTSAANGTEAWRLVQQQPFDLVLLDIDMPGLTGIEVCQRIKATPRLTHLPVVLCSGRLDLAEAAQQAGADDFLEKPYGLLQLTSRLKQLLGSNGLRQKTMDDK